jgi:hypothetical protein
VLLAIAASGGALALAASPASATIITPPPPGAHGEYGGASPDFSYGPAPFYTQMGRNITLGAPGFVPGTSITTAWRGGTASTAWTNGPSIAASNPTGTITSMPRSTCAHVIQVRFTGGVSNVNNGTWTTVPYTEFASTAENCGPTVWLTSSGIEGDGFTPSGQVRVQTFDRNGATLSTQTTTATPSSVTRCGPLGLFPNCITSHLTTGGQIDVANALNTGTPCRLLPQRYSGTDISTGEYDKESDVCFQ